jgi:hypothetical protein
MKQKYLFLTGILGLALVFGLVSTSCDNGSGGETTKVTVTFNRNGATGAPPADKTVDKGARITIPDEGNLTLAGSTFDCWNTSRDGSGTSYYDGDSMRVDDDITLYAQWRQNTQSGGTFTVSTNNNTSNDVATMGLVGTTANSSNTSVATAAITDGKIAIISVSAGTATITVRNASGNEAQIPVTVNANGTITIGTITKYNPNPSPGGNEIDGGITVLALGNGFSITLDAGKIPSPTPTGIQYYVSRPNYTNPVQIYFSMDDIVQNLTIVYPYTESGLEYTVKAQYIGTSKFSKEVNVTPRGGLGEFLVRGTYEVTYLSSNNNPRIRVYPTPNFVPPRDSDPYIRLVVIPNDNTDRYAFATYFDMDDYAEMNVSQFKDDAQNWLPNQFLGISDLYNRQVVIEAAITIGPCLVPLGKTDPFDFPNLNLY